MTTLADEFRLVGTEDLGKLDAVVAALFLKLRVTLEDLDASVDDMATCEALGRRLVTVANHHAELAKRAA